MRNLFVVSAGLVIILGIVSGNLWNELRADRQKIIDLQDQLFQAKTAETESARERAELVAAAVSAAAQAASPAASQAASSAAPAILPAVGPPPPPPLPLPLPLPPNAYLPRVISAPPVVQASVRAPIVGDTEQERRTNALLQSEQTATSRVLAWRDRLALTGQTLTTEQLQELNSAAIAELARETEESMEIDSRSAPTDFQTVARLREETITRQHETNLRILERMTPHLNAEQTNALRAMFEAWAAPRLAAARATREQIAGLGN